jgi:3-isopropylmalate dehydrogenase
MLLEWLGGRRGDARLVAAARAVDAAVDAVLADPSLRTADLGGGLGTKAFGEAVARQVIAAAR